MSYEEEQHPLDATEDAFTDSLRKLHTSKRRPDASLAIADKVAQERAAKKIVPQTQLPDVPVDPKDPRTKRRGRRWAEDALPLSPSRAAAQGLTSILPPMKAKNDARFQAFVFEVTTNPDLRTEYPTWQSLSERFNVSVTVLKTWLLSEEVSKAMAAVVSHEARMAMPSVMRAVRIRAEVTGDPHAAELLRKVAKLGTAESDATKGLESSLRQLALARQQEARLPLRVDARVIDATAKAAVVTTVVPE